MTSAPVVVRLVGEAVALGLSPEPAVFGELYAREWIARRRVCSMKLGLRHGGNP